MEAILILPSLRCLVAHSERTKKVLFIIVDGIPADSIESSRESNLKEMISKGAYSRCYVGGENGTYSETATISAPSYMCLVTGTWGNKHNVYDNGVRNPNYNYKNIFRLYKENEPKKTIGIFSTWIDNRLKLIGEGLREAGSISFDYHADGYELDQVQYTYDNQSRYIHLIDERVVSESCQYLKRFGPDLSWIYLQYSDDMGHLYGHRSEQFNQSIRYFDGQLRAVRESIEYREKHFNEEWLLIVTTDHGRVASDGKGHGGQSLRERTTWMITSHIQMNDYFYQNRSAIVDIYPTIVRFLQLNVSLNDQRELDGIPLIGPISIVQPDVHLHLNQLTIRWQSREKDGNVTIFLSTTNLHKTGLVDPYTSLGTVPVQNEFAQFDLRNYPSNFYKVVLHGKYNMVNRWIVKS